MSWDIKRYTFEFKLEILTLIGERAPILVKTKVFILLCSKLCRLIKEIKSLNLVGILFVFDINYYELGFMFKILFIL